MTSNDGQGVRETTESSPVEAVHAAIAAQLWAADRDRAVARSAVAAIERWLSSRGDETGAAMLRESLHAE